MKEYGYMEGGYLRSRFVTDEEIDNLDKIYKPVETIDESRLKHEIGIVVVPMPYDAGDRIAYNYVERLDSGGIRQEIKRLKQALTETDYKVLKCYEASLVGGTMPYDIGSVHTERQGFRDKINALEDKLR